MQKLALVVDGRPDEELDLTAGLDDIKKTVRRTMTVSQCPDVSQVSRSLLLQKFTLKEGIQIKIRIDFVVQREIVTGLKYVQKTSRMGVYGKVSMAPG